MVNEDMMKFRWRFATTSFATRHGICALKYTSSRPRAYYMASAHTLRIVRPSWYALNYSRVDDVEDWRPNFRHMKHIYIYCVLVEIKMNICILLPMIGRSCEYRAVHILQLLGDGYKRWSIFIFVHLVTILIPISLLSCAVHFRLKNYWKLATWLDL
jgi:hypothetical protein